jgi:hypothetical protein
MNNKIITSITNDTNKRILDLQDTFTMLSENPETKDIFKKLTNMNSSVLYGMFHEVFTGFETLEEAEHTCNVLINALLDDLGIYLTTKIIGKEATDSIRKIKGKENYPYLTEEVVTMEENSEWLCQSSLLEYIDRHEKKIIKHCNAFYTTRSKTDKDKAFLLLGDLNSRTDNFNEDNISLLHTDIIKHFNITTI